MNNTRGHPDGNSLLDRFEVRSSRIFFEVMTKEYNRLPRPDPNSKWHLLTKIKRDPRGHIRTQWIKNFDRNC